MLGPERRVRVSRRKPIGHCRECDKPVYPGEPFDMAMEEWAADFPGDIAGSMMIFWHRRCNPMADHSKDGP